VNRVPAILGLVTISTTGLVGCAGPRRAQVDLPPPAPAQPADEVNAESIALAPSSLVGRPVQPPAEGAPAPGPSGAPSETPTISDAEPAEPATPERVERVRVDALVGQINGRPLFASEFFEPMDARLRAEAQRRTPEEWLRFARDEIRAALRDRIRDELLLAEVESSLTPEQRAGVVTFVRSLREDLVSRNRGSAARADRRLLEEEGITLEQAVEARRNEELIRSWLRQILQNKVLVPWREVRQRYERDRDRFNPPATAILRMIRVPAADTERVGSVRAALESGETFEAVAARLSTFSPESGGLLERVLDGPYERAALIGLPELNAAAQRLTPGEVAGPIEVGANVYWIRLEEVREISQPLYDVQVQIMNELFAERVREAEEEYFTRLLERSGLGTGEQIQRMERRLFEIAAERYLLTAQG